MTRAVHLHVALGRADLTVIGGHLREAIVLPTLEVWLRTEPVDVRRTKDPATGLDLLDLPTRGGDAGRHHGGRCRASHGSTNTATSSTDFRVRSGTMQSSAG